MPPLKQSIVLDLPQLKQLDVSGICGLFDLLKAAPNLDDLMIDFDCLKILIDDDSTRNLLEQQIIHLAVNYWADIESDMFQRIIEIFHRLRYLRITLENTLLYTKSILSTILAQLNIKQLTLLSVGNAVSDDIIENLRQWVIDQTYLTTDDSFAVDCMNNRFILWK